MYINKLYWSFITLYSYYFRKDIMFWLIYKYQHIYSKWKQITFINHPYNIKYKYEPLHHYTFNYANREYIVFDIDVIDNFNTNK